MKIVARLFSLALLLAAGAVAYLMFETTPAPAPDSGPLGRVTRIVVDKSDRVMVVYQDERPLRRYKIALGFAPMGDKARQGDGRTPEGTFRIDRKNDQSAFTLSLGLDYPQADDRARAAKGGYDPGGDIMIHGQPTGTPDSLMGRGDWTAGCIAVPNLAIREIFAATDIGTEVLIRP